METNNFEMRIEGKTLKVTPDMELTINGQMPHEHEVVEFILDFAKESLKEPSEPNPLLVEMVEKVTEEEEEKNNG